MKVEKLPSGNFRIQKQYKGKRYSLTFDHKPTQKEIIQALASILDEKENPKNGTGKFKDYVDKYIAKCEKDNLSPSTISGYDSMKRNISLELMHRNFFDVNEDDIQDFIDEYADTRSAKTVRNMNGFIHSIMSEYRPNYKYTIDLPKGEKKPRTGPTTKEVFTLVEYSKKTRYSIAIQLAVLGLRRGEVLAITSNDLSADDVLTINKDIVINKDGEYVIKIDQRMQLLIEVLPFQSLSQKN